MLDWLFRWRRRDREIQDEIEYHLQMLAEDQMDRGATVDEAQFAAQRKLGNSTRAKESVRAVWLRPAVEDFCQDVAYTLRSFRKAPGFFGLVTVILALRIGASVSVFSLVDGILLRPLPYRDPQRLFMLMSYAPRPPFDSNGSISFNDYLKIKAKTDAFSDVAITFRDGWSRVTLTGGSEPVSVQGAFVSPNLFALAGRAPILGRMFTTEEDQCAERVVVISESLWAERFGESPSVLGRDLEINHVRWRIIGVAGSDFRLPFLDAQLWAPVHSRPGWNSASDNNLTDLPRWDVIARLKPGVSASTAQAEVDSIWEGLRRALQDNLHANDLRVVPLRQHFSGRVQRPMWFLFGAVVFLLLIACANVANLLLARSTNRSREFSVRSALGAGHARLLRQLMTEAITFTLLAGACGAILAFELVPLLTRFAPVNTPFLNDVALSGRGLMFALLVSLVVGLLLGFAPILRLSPEAIATNRWI
jgi:predicted permease